MERLQRIMIGNGLLVVLASMFAGFMLMFSLIGGIEIWPGTIVPLQIYGTNDGWVRAHSGGAMNGILIIVVALALPTLRLSPLMQRITAYGFIYVAWSFTFFYWVGNAAGNRGLTLGDSQLGETDVLSVIGFLPALLSVFLVVYLLVVAARGVLARGERGCAARRPDTLKAYSLLDLAPVTHGSEPAQAFSNSLDLARRAEALGYERFWLAEHHNMPGIASAATAVVIGHIAGGTNRIRVGAGGIMLPNHSPLVIAEQFGTLESLYPGRIDLGLGRAPGTDPLTSRALRRDARTSADRFPDDVVEIQALFAAAQPRQGVRAVPGAGLDVPIWILGSSLFGASLAAALGLPFAFASHFAPEALLDAIRIYRENFKPAGALEKPHVMVGINCFIAESEAEARRMFTSLQVQFANLFRGTPGKLQPPLDDIDAYWTAGERAGVERALRYTLLGTPRSAARQLEQFVASTAADEVMLTGQIHDHSARLRSFEFGAEICRALITGKTLVSSFD
jgi:luciferase family oxidoreductase group 1